MFGFAANVHATCLFLFENHTYIYSDRAIFIHLYIYIYIFISVLIYSHFFIFGIFIFGRGGYNNAKPAKSYFLFLKLAAALPGNGESAKSKFFTTITSLIPKSKMQNSAAAAADF